MTVKASRQRDMGEEKNGLEHRETSHGSFERSMTLPEGAGPSATYIEAIAPSVLKKYRVRQVFGSRQRAGWPFGREVPALVVVGPSAIAEDVKNIAYPGAGP